MSRWLKLRKEMSDYPATDQQKKIRVAGKVLSIICTGKTGLEFRSCRADVLACFFNKDNPRCTIEVERAKKEVEEELNGKSAIPSQTTETHKE